MKEENSRTIAETENNNNNCELLTTEPAEAKKVKIEIEYMIKGFLLLLWLLILAAFAMIAATGNARNLVKISVNKIKIISKISDPTIDSAYDCLEQYSINALNQDVKAPPQIIACVLDQICPKWIEAYKINIPNKSDKRKLTQQEKLIMDQYEALFRGVNQHLGAIVLGNSENCSDKRESIVNLNVFKAICDNSGKSSVEFPIAARNLPITVKSWIKKEKDDLKLERARNQLIDTFFILMVLGALGSMIFLLKDFIQREESLNISNYFTRPVFGMFLAMTMFTIDVMLNSIISTAPMEAIRPEPLYLLALGAGLLSDQAYKALKIRAERALENLEEDKKHKKQDGIDKK